MRLRGQAPGARRQCVRACRSLAQHAAFAPRPAAMRSRSPLVVLSTDRHVRPGEATVSRRWYAAHPSWDSLRSRTLAIAKNWRHRASGYFVWKSLPRGEPLDSVSSRRSVFAWPSPLGRGSRYDLVHDGACAGATQVLPTSLGLSQESSRWMLRAGQTHSASAQRGVRVHMTIRHGLLFRYLSAQFSSSMLSRSTALSRRLHDSLGPKESCHGHHNRSRSGARVVADGSKPRAAEHCARRCHEAQCFFVGAPLCRSRRRARYCAIEARAA